MMTLKEGVFQICHYVISLLHKMAFGTLKEVIFFLNIRAADVLKKESHGFSVCVRAHVRLCLMPTVLLWFLCNIAHIFYLENHFPLHILCNKHETT